MTRNNYFFVATGLLSYLFIFYFIRKYDHPIPINKAKNPAVISDSLDTIINTPDTVFLRICSVGDVMVHETQLKAQYQLDSTYSFDNNFKYFTSLFKEYDVAIANLETTFTGAKRKYSAYPRFNSPDELASSLKNAGINLVSTANNHCYDFLGDGLFRTIKVLQNQGLDHVGTRLDTTENAYLIREVKGVKIGFTSFTYESGVNSINGIAIRDQEIPLINSFSISDYSDDLNFIVELYNEMKKNGSELEIMIIHWGDEYQSSPNKFQKAFSAELQKIGFEIVFGSHPHVVQPIDFLYADTTNQLTFVAYSMGNFISNQRYESNKNYRTEDGLFVGVEFFKTKDSIGLHKICYEPTWVNRFKDGIKYQYEVVPANLAFQQRDSFNCSSNEVYQRLTNSRTRTMNLIEKPIDVSKNYFFDKYLEKNN